MYHQVYRIILEYRVCYCIYIGRIREEIQISMHSDAEIVQAHFMSYFLTPMKISHGSWSKYFWNYLWSFQLGIYCSLCKFPNLKCDFIERMGTTVMWHTISQREIANENGVWWSMLTSGAFWKAKRLINPGKLDKLIRLLISYVELTDIMYGSCKDLRFCSCNIKFVISFSRNYHIISGLKWSRLFIDTFPLLSVNFYSFYER